MYLTYLLWTCFPILTLTSKYASGKIKKLITNKTNRKTRLIVNSIQCWKLKQPFLAVHNCMWKCGITTNFWEMSSSVKRLLILKTVSFQRNGAIYVITPLRPESSLLKRVPLAEARCVSGWKSSQLQTPRLWSSSGQ